MIHERQTFTIKFCKAETRSKEKVLFRSQTVNAGANGTLEYTIKEGVNKSKIADAQLIKNKK